MFSRLVGLARKFLSWPPRWVRRSRSHAGTEQLGPKSEQAARAFLERAGFRILAANYRCPLGELDLVAEEQGRLVFVEVKARRVRSSSAGAGPAEGRAAPRPEAAVNRHKQRRIGRAARYFCRTHHRQDAAVRFDVVAVEWPDSGEPVVRHHKGAFRPDV